MPLDTTQTMTYGTARDRDDREIVVLVVLWHPVVAHLGARVPVQSDPIALGRASDAFGPRVLDSRHISRRHAEVCTEGARVLVRDLDSRNGTFVNGVKVDCAEISPGDVIRIGDVLLLLDTAPRFYRQPNHPEMIGISSALAGVMSEIEAVAIRTTTVLILGETGVGKELVARQLHRLSGRGGPFVAVNCGNLQDELLQSELFGHTKGAFSGAHAQRKGLVEEARGGTLFLDEVGDASPAVQVSLLRLLQEGEYRPVGSNKTCKADVRVIAATHRDVHADVENDRFRKDLHARLARWVITVPPLRQRRIDIPHLALHFAAAHAGRPMELSAGLVQKLVGHDWPRNVRELDALMERLVVHAAQAAIIDAPTLSFEGQSRENTPPPSRPTARRRARVPRPDAATLMRAIDASNGNIRDVARHFDVARSTIYRWMEREGLAVDALRSGQK